MTTSSDVESTSEISATEKQVARKMCDLRRENGLTLRGLGERTGLSESYLSRVENLKTAISISNLTKVAEAFVVPVSVFFEASEIPAKLVLKRAGEGKTVRLRGRNGVNVRLLASDMPERMMEPFIVDVSSAQGDIPMQSHSGQEFIHVLSGRCRFYYGSDEFELAVGDALYFDSTVNHRIEPIEGVACECVAVVTSKDFSFHGNIAKLLND